MMSGRQRAILDFLREWQSGHPYPPSTREIGSGTGTSSTSVVVYNLKLLRRAGLVQFIDNESRTAVLAGSEYMLPPVVEEDWRVP